MATESDSYSIVVGGNMNPAIHTPSWYASAGILTEDEQRATLSDATFVAGPNYSTFDTGTFAVECTSEVWQTRTRHAGHLNRLLEIASKTHEVLDQTPVNRYGVYAGFHRSTEQPDVGTKLAAFVRSLPFGIDETTEGTATVSYWFRRDDAHVHLEIQPSLQDRGMVYFGLSTEHRPTGGGHFDLTPLLAKAVEPDFEFARQMLARVVAGLR